MKIYFIARAAAFLTAHPAGLDSISQVEHPPMFVLQAGLLLVPDKTQVSPSSQNFLFSL